LQELEEGAIQNLMEKTPQNLRKSFKMILTDHNSEEYHIARIADLFDILNQSRDYEKKKWLDETQSEAFQTHAIHQLKNYEDQFAFIKLVLAEFNL
jgi:5'-deoxynucleotidase YfbR-like HD superfamily hydrolase